jgi:hypothetical protein
MSLPARKTSCVIDGLMQLIKSQKKTVSIIGNQEFREVEPLAGRSAIRQSQARLARLG